MGLTSGWLIALCAAVAVVALAVMIRAWPRLVRPRPSHLLGRAGLLIWAQVAVMSLIFVCVNRSSEFFATWSDLFGTNQTTGVVVPAPHGTDVQPSPIQPSPIQPSPIQPSGTGSPVTPAGASPGAAGWTGLAQAGELQLVHITGPRSGIAATAYVYLPPQYFRPGPAGRKFPVIMAISDRLATAGDADSATAIAATAAGEIGAGRARPAIYVMLPASVAGPRDRGCLDVPAGPQAATFFSQDVPTAIDAAYPASRAAAGWAVLGDATGGYCALWLAMAHSDRFAVAAAPPAGYGLPPGATGTTRGSTGWWLFGGSQALRKECDLGWRLRHWPPQPISVLFLRAATAPRGARQPPGGPAAGNAQDGAQVFVALAAPPMRVGTVTLGAGARPLAPALDRISAELAPDAAPVVAWR